MLPVSMACVPGFGKSIVNRDAHMVAGHGSCCLCDISVTHHH
jgi:hypothetical protein